MLSLDVTRFSIGVLCTSPPGWGKIGSVFCTDCDVWDPIAAGRLGLCAAPGANVFCCKDVPIHTSCKADAGGSVLFTRFWSWLGVCDRDELWAPIAWLAVQKKFVAAVDVQINGWKKLLLLYCSHFIIRWVFVCLFMI